MNRELMQRALDALVCETGTRLDGYEPDADSVAVIAELRAALAAPVAPLPLAQSTYKVTAPYEQCSGPMAAPVAPATTPPAQAANRYCRAGMCVATDAAHEPGCNAHNHAPVAPADPTHLRRADGTLSGMFIEPARVELATSGRPDIRNPALAEVLDAVCERHSIALSAGLTSRTAMLRALQEAWRRLAAPAAPARTDEQIVEQTERLAALLAGEFFGMTLKTGHYRTSRSPRAFRCWIVACRVQELLTNTSPDDAASAIDAEPAPAAPTRDQLAKLIEGMSVSVDVSTGEHDLGHRLMGTVTEVMDDEHDKHGVTLLVQDANPNFTPADVVPRSDAYIRLDVHEFKAIDLLRRVVINLRPNRRRPFWATVKDATGLGSTCSWGLCELFGRDPDTGKALPVPQPATTKGKA